MTQLVWIFFTIVLAVSPSVDKKSTPYEVYVFLHDECIISRYYTIPLNELQTEYSDVATFIGVFPNPTVDMGRLKSFESKYKMQFELRNDPEMTLVRKFDATITPEVFVIQTDTKELVYSGRIDNAYARVGKKRTIVTQHELADVLEAVKAGKNPEIAHQPAIGCLITPVKSTEK